MLANARRNRAALAALLGLVLTLGAFGLFQRFAAGATWWRALPFWFVSMAIADRVLRRLAPIDKEDRPQRASSPLDDLTAPGTKASFVQSSSGGTLPAAAVGPFAAKEAR